MCEFEIFRSKGKEVRSISARIIQDQFRIDTQDIGSVAKEVWGEPDYEFWTSVPKEAWGDLLMALAKEFLSGDENATDRLRDICRRHNVEHTWQNWV